MTFEWCINFEFIISFISLILGIIGVIFGYKKWGKEACFKRVDIMGLFLQNLNECNLLKAASSLDSDEGISNYISNLKYNFYDIENDLNFISRLCYLYLENVISDKEFSLFKDIIVKVLGDKGIRKYITDMLSDSNLQPENSRYRILFEFANKEGITIVNNQSECNNVDIDNLEYISKEDFDCPTMVVKINRRYRAGMTDKEVYEACRGWWRLNIERAGNIKLVLAVANGIIQGVYVPKNWISSNNSNNSNNLEETVRYAFEGKGAEDRIRNRFINRSVRNLFPRGAQNPIAYFNND